MLRVDVGAHLIEVDTARLARAVGEDDDVFRHWTIVVARASRLAEKATGKVVY